MVFLVEEIESKKHVVLKFYRSCDIACFKEEVDANLLLLTSLKVQKALKAVVERENMTPFITDSGIYMHYSYIILPFCSKGTIIDFLITA